MSEFYDRDLYAGISGIDLAHSALDLGDGIFMTTTYAHQFAPFMFAFKKPEERQPHPGPWKAARGGLSFEISAELLIPAGLEKKYGSKVSLARLLVSTLRIGVNPAITLPAFSSAPFGSISDIPDAEIVLQPFEVETRHFPLSATCGELTPQAALWVKERWRVAHRLKKNSAEFELAFDALDRAQFVQNSALALVSVWAALEALFSPSTSELSFRVSSLIASYLEEPGNARLARQKAIAKLYAKRSAAAHGKPNHSDDNLLDSINLLREVVIKMLDEGEVPSPEHLQMQLFGAFTSNPAE